MAAACAGGDPVGQLEKDVGRHDPGLGIGPPRTGAVGDTVARRQSLDARPDGLDDARAFGAEKSRQVDRIKPAPMIGLDEIEPDRLVAHQNLARPRLAELDIDELHDLRPAGLGDADGFGGGHGVVLPTRDEVTAPHLIVIPANAGIQFRRWGPDPRLRADDVGRGERSTEIMPA